MALLSGTLVLLLLQHFHFAIGADQNRSFLISQDAFVKDGQQFRILGGEMHYFRIVPQYWKDRLLRAKSMGLNTVQTYIPWNLHEPLEGVYNFHAEADVEAYLRLAQSLELLVMLRIGPYVCGEWDFGGFPSWLLSKQPALRLRTSDGAYLQLIENWWSVLLPKLLPFLYSRGGPVIMLQLENEYGSYNKNQAYLHFLAVLARKYLGEDVILYTTDGATEEALSRGSNAQDNIYAAVDFPTGWDPVAAFALQKRFNLPGKSPPLSAEFYTGWLTHWGESLAKTSAKDTATELDRVLAANASVVLYMAHGGSNFGFYSGANTGSGANDYEPDITSYDYDAPIGEAGDITNKFKHLRNTLAKYVTASLPVPPRVPSRRAYKKTYLQKSASLFGCLDILSQGQEHHVPVSMEQLNQISGFTMYMSILPGHAKSGSNLSIGEVHDRAQVFMGTSREALTRVGTLSRWSTSMLTLPSGACQGLQLWILVENMGRINYGKYIYDPKGILSLVLLDNVPIVNWTIYPLDLTNAWSVLQDWGWSKYSLQKDYVIPDTFQGPWFYSGVFEADSPADTFLSLRGWSKGVAFLNGFNLGRFWPAAGPQCTLYVPGPLLQPGQNKLLILELESAPLEQPVEFRLQHDWTCQGNKEVRITGSAMTNLHILQAEY